MREEADCAVVEDFAKSTDESRLAMMMMITDDL